MRFEMPNVFSITTFNLGQCGAYTCIECQGIGQFYKGKHFCDFLLASMDDVAFSKGYSLKGMILLLRE